MKKLIIISAVFIIVVAVTACTVDNRNIDQNNADNTGDVTEVIVKRKGVIEVKKMKLYEEGTHYLKQESGDKILLKSKKVGINEFVDQKVLVRGGLGETIKGEKIINVLSVEIEKDEETGSGEDMTSVTIYKSKNLQVSFKKPGVLKVEESEEKIELKREDLTVISIEVTDVAKKDVDGVTINVDEEEGLKVNKDDGSIEVYLFPEDRNSYLISYHASDEEHKEENKSFYFSILDSWKVLSSTNEQGQMKCGGKSNKRCKEGSYCELSGAEKWSEGICVATDSLIDEPVLVVDKEEGDEEPAEEFLPDGEEIKDGAEASLSDTEKRVQSYINTKISTILPEDDEVGDEVQVERFEFSDPSLVSITYSSGEAKRKVTYSYTIDSDLEDVKLEQKAYFKPGESTDWELVDGENVQAGKASKIVGEGDEVKYVPEGYALFSYNRYGYETNYPKSWYYASFNGQGEVVSHSAFSKESVEQGQNELVSVDLMGKSLEELGKTHLQEEVSDGVLKIYVKKDEKQSFVVYGEEGEYGEVVRVMAEQLTVED